MKATANPANAGSSEAELLCEGKNTWPMATAM